MVNALITTVLTKNNRPISADFLVEYFNRAGIVLEEI